MTKRVCINGFGRIGRLFFRAAFLDHPEIEIVSINDLFDPKYLAYSLKYDSVQKGWPGTVVAEPGALIINGKKIPITAERDPANLPHASNNIDVVMEATGFFVKREGAQKHIDAKSTRHFLIFCGIAFA